MCYKVAFIDIAAFRDIQLGDGTGVAGHDIGFIAGLHRTGVLAHINTVGVGAPCNQKHHKETDQDDKGVAVRRHIPVHHDAAILQVRQILNIHRHNYLISIKTSTTASSSSWLTKMV